MKARMLLIGLIFSGCVTASNTTTESSARWQNAGIGAAIGCAATGPFCVLAPLGPVIGAVIGGVISPGEGKPQEVKADSVEERTEDGKLTPIQSRFGEKQHNFYK